ncbi:MAG: ABC transporter permease [Defluviitaleaceae bacterium]|nr:ABC transporter permease [Defluviitaleaceae bacterium]
MKLVVYILKRLGLMLISLFMIVTITFFLMRSIPGDPLSHMARSLPEQTRANFMARYGLDQPLFNQYLIYLRNLAQGDLGESLAFPGRSVTETIGRTSPVSAQGGGIALAIGLVIGTVLGIIAALFRNRLPDYIVMIIAILGVTVPVFVIAPLLQLVFAVRLGWLPTFGWGTPRHMVMPVMVMAFLPIATYARYMKSSMLDTLGQDYILTAQSKGVSETNVILKHALRNSLLPAITILSGSIVGIFTGAFVVESIFSIPGIGTHFVTSIHNNDYTMIMGTTVFFAVLFVVMQFVVDFIYVLVDPRIKLMHETH